MKPGKTHGQLAKQHRAERREQLATNARLRAERDPYGQDTHMRVKNESAATGGTERERQRMFFREL